MKYKLIISFLIAFICVPFLIYADNYKENLINQELDVYPFSNIEKYIVFDLYQNKLQTNNEIASVHYNDLKQIDVELKYPLKNIRAYLYDGKDLISELSFIEENDSTYKYQYYENLQFNHNYNIQIVSDDLILEKDFTYELNQSNWQVDYEIIDNDLIKINFKDNFKQIGYLYPNNFKGYIINDHKNNFIIKLEENLIDGEIYDFNLKYSIDKNNESITNLYGYFKYQFNNNPLKINKVSILSNKRIKIEFNKNIATNDNLNDESSYISIFNKNNNELYIKSKYFISNNQIILEFNDVLKEENYYIDINNIKDSFGKKYSFDNFNFKVDLLSSSHNIFITSMNSKVYNQIEVTFNKDISNIKQLFDINNFSLKSLDNYNSKYKIENIELVNNNQLLITTNVINPNENLSLFINSIKDDQNNTFSNRSYNYTSGLKDEQQANIIDSISYDYFFKDNLLKNDGLYIKAELNQDITEKDNISILYNDTILKRTYYYDKNVAYFLLQKEDINKHITFKINDISKSIYIPDLSLDLKYQAYGLQLNEKTIVKLVFSEPINVNKFKNTTIYHNKNKLLYEISNNEKYEKEIIITIDGIYDKLQISIPSNAQESIYNNYKNQYNDINVEIANFNKFNVVKSVSVINQNTIRVILNQNVSFLSTPIQITDLNKSIILNNYDIKEGKNYFDIIFKEDLDQKYQVTFPSHSFKHNSIGDIMVDYTFTIEGLDLIAYITPYINKEWSQIEGVSEILIGINNDGTYYIYGEPNSVEQNSTIQIYSSEYELIGSVKTQDNGSFPKITIPLEYYIQDGFTLECIDSKGNVSKIEIKI